MAISKVKKERFNFTFGNRLHIHRFGSFEIRYPASVNRWPGKGMRIKSRPVSSLSRLQGYYSGHSFYQTPSKNLFFENYNFSVFCSSYPTMNLTASNCYALVHRNSNEKTHYAFTNHPQSSSTNHFQHVSWCMNLYDYVITLKSGHNMTDIR